MLITPMYSIRLLPNDIFENKKILDIGCGKKKLVGSIGLDHISLNEVDIISSLENHLPFSDSAFDLVFASQVLEHIQDLTLLLEEIHRILKPGGQLVAHVPYFRSGWAHIDPTHVRSFTINTLDYYAINNWISDEFGLGKIKYSRIDKFIDIGYPSTFTRKIFSAIALRYPIRYENSILSFFYPFQGLSFILCK